MATTPLQPGAAPANPDVCLSGAVDALDDILSILSSADGAVNMMAIPIEDRMGASAASAVYALGFVIQHAYDRCTALQVKFVEARKALAVLS